MNQYKTKNLRNVGIIGHSGDGKTTLTEALLYYTNTIERFGKVDEENTVSDYDVEEKKRKISISLAVAPCEWQEMKINLIDIPGYFDFIGEMIEGLTAVDLAMIVVSASGNIKVGAEKAWNCAKKYKLPRAFFINKMDRENSNFDKTISNLKDKFGFSVVPIQYPIGSAENFKGIVNVISNKARYFNKTNGSMEEGEVPEEIVDKVNDCKRMIEESVAESNEELLDKYLAEGYLEDKDIYDGLIRGCSNGEIVPVMCGSAYYGIGIKTLLEDIVKLFPAPDELKTYEVSNVSDGKKSKISINPELPFSAHIFKTIADPFIGKLSIFRVMTGAIKADTTVYNANKGRNEKIGNLYYLRGKSQVSAEIISAGDIGAATKLQFTATGDTLCDVNMPITYESMEFPNTQISFAAVPKSKGDEEKISSGLNKLLEEDLTFKVTRDVENAETIVSGLGETHLEVISSKLKNKFGASVNLELPKIAYRETIKKCVDVQGKHKKQSGGHGQYGDVWIKFEPRNDGEDELLFVDEVVGGVVPRQYIPAVEKGLKEVIHQGVLAGYPVIGLKATLHDGSYHPVDSSEMAFKVAASLAYKKGIESASPVMLEPIMHIEVMIPEEYLGDIIADINKKRGRVLGMDSEEGIQRVSAEVPQSEILRYATDLRSMTHARGNFMMRFERYEEVPEIEAKKIIANKTKVLEKV